MGKKLNLTSNQGIQFFFLNTAFYPSDGEKITWLLMSSVGQGKGNVLSRTAGRNIN